jgi:hypothetical protein
VDINNNKVIIDFYKIKYPDIKCIIINFNTTIVELESGGIGKTVCQPQDKYSVNRGIEIAYLKIKIRELNKQCKNMIKELKMLCK